MARDDVCSVLERTSGLREDLIPILQQVQEVEGFISAEAIALISRRLRVSENEIYGVATFYAQFRFHPPGEHHIAICMGTACHVRGGAQLSATLEHRLGITRGETTLDGKYDYETVACLGCCALAPVVRIDDKIYSQMSVLKLRKVLDECEQT